MISKLSKLGRSKKMVNKRKHIRFKPDENTLLRANFKTGSGKQFIGLVFNEAYSGCGAAMLPSEEIKNGVECVIKCGEMGLMDAKVRWIKIVDEDLIKVGFEYITK